MSAAIDLTGRRFGMLTVIERSDNSAHGRAQWRCVCDCGSAHVVAGKYLRNGDSRSCGCGFVVRCACSDVTGQRFGRWTALGRVSPPGTGSRWTCICDCGNSAEVALGNLTHGGSMSCGCLNLEAVSLMHAKRSLAKHLDVLYGPLEGI